ncbi:DNA photolyase family protein [Cellulomonas sp. DKR-3]|uniref:DNA photolyase family protein n=1 Tax=Cellulomonas fulva TaxID=2835530 RepID=A0ABS5TYJ2_9CELL|nr:deoxyribodipyrimidine photo-lyase [Cellulomonas fulva]MBT0994176.1 DNA photolyase family protein [Cellulomonas fulva]
MPVVHWFRRDLRLADNPALGAAVRAARDAGDEVVALYVLDPALWRTSGRPRLAYLAASLAALAESCDGRLVVRHGRAQEVVPAVAREVGAAEVHVTAATEPYGRQRDDAVVRALGDAALVPTGSPYAVGPGRLTTQAGEPFQVFTPFRRAWLDHGWAAPAPRPRAIPWAQVRSDPLPDAPATEARLPAAGEHAALRRWHAYLEDGLAGYASARDRPDLDATSVMSVPLKWGEIHPRTLLADLAALPRRAGGPSADDVTRFRSELVWREFHADVLWHHPGARTRSLRPVLPDDAWARGAAADAAFEAWCAGRTGYPLVDAGMRQLLATGWMHNRVRMVVASFLVKDLHVPWQRGAEHFLAHLVDGDVAQNQLNWQWVAGTGRDAAPYFRVFNPVTQGEKFDPDGDYVRRWVPELREVAGAAVHRPWDLGLTRPADYPERLVDHARERERALADLQRGKAERAAR